MKRWIAVYVVAIALGLTLGSVARQSWQPTPAVLNQAWGWVQSCSAVVTEKGKNPSGALENVVWKTFVPGAFNDSVPGAIIGMTIRTPGVAVDTIYIDTEHLDTVWVIAHELLHHVLADESVWGTAHPFVPFAFPCHLMGWQQGPGIGLMGQGSGKKSRTP
jgi:hypothetical protein